MVTWLAPDVKIVPHPELRRKSNKKIRFSAIGIFLSLSLYKFNAETQRKIAKKIFFLIFY